MELQYTDSTMAEMAKVMATPPPANVKKTTTIASWIGLGIGGTIGYFLFTQKTTAAIGLGFVGAFVGIVLADRFAPNIEVLK
jgi:hypothetical protein